MKNRTRIILLSAAAVLLAAAVTVWCFLPHPLNYPIRRIAAVGSAVEITAQGPDEVSIRKTSDGSFKVLMFTDLHLDGKNKTSYETVRRLVENIQNEKPDLVLLGGDNVTSAFNRYRAHQLAQIFEKLGVYWAGTIGNHEGDNALSIHRDDMVSIFSSYPHCLMQAGLPEVSGDCNYALNLFGENGKLIHTFFFMDTYDEMSEALKEQYGLDPAEDYYDGVREDQVQWYSGKAESIRDRFGHCVSTVLVHIPLPQMQTALDEGNGLLYGEKNENVCCSGFDSGLFDAIVAADTTKTVFCGHDHLNTFGVSYRGVLLSYIEPSGYGSYTMLSRRNAPESEWLQGCTELLIRPDGSFEQRQIRNHGAA